jgi:hypothetical protein
MEPHIGSMNPTALSARFARLIMATAMLACLPLAAAAAEAVFPVGSRLGLAPPSELKPATSFPGFEDNQNRVFVRLVALPGAAYAEIDKTMTSEALKKQGMTVEKREPMTVGGIKGILAIVRQDTPVGRIRKWLLVAPVGDLTALVSLETPFPVPASYPDAIIRTTLTSLAARPTVPPDEQLTLVPFRLGDIAGMRLVRVVPGVAVQLTDGPKDTLDATEQPHMVIAASPGGPDPRDRDQFARSAMSGLPPYKELRITNAEPMRVGGQPGYEVRAEGKDAQGATIDIVQWLRFGTGAYLRIVGIAPKEKWADSFTRFRAVRDGLEPR